MLIFCETHLLIASVILETISGIATLSSTNQVSCTKESSRLRDPLQQKGTCPEAFCGGIVQTVLISIIKSFTQAWTSLLRRRLILKVTT